MDKAKYPIFCRQNTPTTRVCPPGLFITPKMGPVYYDDSDPKNKEEWNDANDEVEECRDPYKLEAKYEGPPKQEINNWLNNRGIRPIDLKVGKSGLLAPPPIKGISPSA